MQNVACLIKTDSRSKDTVYAVQNNGRYLFQIDLNGTVSAPVTQVTYSS